MLSALYAAFVRRRRERFASRPDLRRRLTRPVISVGNLAVGGRGKTPLTATIARMLLEMGERPAVLSRGYARARHEDGVVVVRDATGIRADLARAGDEPLMLARQLPGVAVLVCPDRYLAGRLAEHHLGASVHVLDDGFQHLQLDRDIDLLIVSREDVEQPRTLPAGRLREPLDTIIAADALLTSDDVVIEAQGTDLPVFRLRRSGAFEPPDGRPVLALAGIASPERFLADLREHACNVVSTMIFADHHRYGRKDVERMSAEASRAGAARIVTTEKDFVRLLPLRPWGVPVEYVQMSIVPEPVDEFRDWIGRELATVRGALGG